MTEHGQLRSVLALYWAFVGTVASIDYLLDYHLLADGLGVGSTVLTVFYLVWFLTLVRGIPETLEVAFS